MPWTEQIGVLSFKERRFRVSYKPLEMEQFGALRTIGEIVDTSQIFCEEQKLIL